MLTLLYICFAKLNPRLKITLLESHSGSATKKKTENLIFDRINSLGFPTQKVVCQFKSWKEWHCLALSRLGICGNLTSNLPFEAIFLTFPEIVSSPWSKQSKHGLDYGVSCKDVCEDANLGEYLPPEWYIKSDGLEVSRIITERRGYIQFDLFLSIKSFLHYDFGIQKWRLRGRSHRGKTQTL